MRKTTKRRLSNPQKRKAIEELRLLASKPATIEIKFVSELQSALDIAGKIDFGPIGGEIGVSIKEKSIHEMTKSIKIYFGDVPNEVQDKFKSI